MRDLAEVSAGELQLGDVLGEEGFVSAIQRSPSTVVVTIGHRRATHGLNQTLGALGHIEVSGTRTWGHADRVKVIRE